MSECRVCKTNGKAGVQITFSDKIRSNYSNKMIPLETDGSTYHKHYEPTKTAIPEPNDYPNPITNTAKTISPTKEDAALEALTQEFRTLLKHIKEYVGSK